MKTVPALMAKVHIAHQATQDSISISFLLLVPPLKVIKHMHPKVQTKLTHIIIAGRNTAVPLPIEPVSEKNAVQSERADSVWFNNFEIFVSSQRTSEITGNLQCITPYNKKLCVDLTDKANVESPMSFSNARCFAVSSGNMRLVASSSRKQACVHRGSKFFGFCFFISSLYITSYILYMFFQPPQSPKSLSPTTTSCSASSGQGGKHPKAGPPCPSNLFYD
jgi:hypothetical protein